MFNTPAKYVPMERNMEELKKFSLPICQECFKPLTYGVCNGQIAFVDEDRCTYVTPARTSAYDVLYENGYQKTNMFIPFFSKKNKGERYYDLEKMAEESTWNKTFSYAKAKSNEKAIKDINIKNNFIEKIKDVTKSSIIAELDNGRKYSVSGMINPYLIEECEKNIASFICLDNRNVILCDDYGRTFLVKLNKSFSNFICALICAGYKLTTRPELYVKRIK